MISHLILRVRDDLLVSKEIFVGFIGRGPILSEFDRYQPYKNSVFVRKRGTWGVTGTGEGV